MTSFHYCTERSLRETVIRAIGRGKIVKVCKVDRGHPDGPEIHKITDTGIIIIENAYTHKLVTKLIARPGQLRRYFKNGHVPYYLFKQAKEHQQKGYNSF